MEFTNCFSRMFPIILVFFRSTVDLKEDCFDLDFEMVSFEFRIVSLVSIGFDFCFRAVSFTMLWFIVNSCFRFWIRDVRFDIVVVVE